MQQQQGATPPGKTSDRILQRFCPRLFSWAFGGIKKRPMKQRKLSYAMNLGRLCFVMPAFAGHRGVAHWINPP